MFAAAGTEQEDVHARVACPKIRGVLQGDAVTAYFSPPDAAMISCKVATWRAKAPRPAAVAVTVVCGFLPTKALSTAT